MRQQIVSALLASTILVLSSAVSTIPPAHGFSDPTDFVLLARILGWNSTNPGPGVVEFRTVTFTVTIKSPDTTHNFAIYTGNYSGSVSTGNPCDLQRTTPGCLARILCCISPSGPTAKSLNFTSSVPQDNGAGLGGYEYFCEIHPGFMHGKIKVFKDPDLNNNGMVDLTDAAMLGAAYNTGPTSPNWNAAADFNNDLRINIFDAAVLGRYYPQVLVD